MGRVTVLLVFSTLIIIILNLKNNQNMEIENSFFNEEKGVTLLSPIGKQGSHQLSGMAEANTLSIIPDGDGVPKGNPIEYFRF